MQATTQLGIIAGGALAAYVMGRLTPQPASHTASEPISVDETNETMDTTVEVTPIQEVESEVYCAWDLKSTKDLDFDIIQMVTEQSLCCALEQSCDIAKQKALQIGEWGFPSCSNLRFYDSYCSSINYYRSQPNWCGEYISRDDVTKNEEVDRKHCHFHEDESVPEKFRSLLKDFRGSGLSRGHLVPAGDHNACQKNKDLTFRLTSNVVPQEMSMNGGDWLRVERFVKRLIVSQDTDIEKCWIFTGPVFKPKTECDFSYSKPITIKDKETNEEKEILKVYNRPKRKAQLQNDCVGNSMVHVPTHLFKVILAERGDENVENQEENEDVENQEKNVEKYQLAAFMVQNEAIHDYVPITDYLVDIDELEHLVGLEFFSKLRNNNDISYGELCANYNCGYDDDERSIGWRGLGMIKSAQTVSELEYFWNEAQQKEYDADWMLGLYRRTYFKRKRELIEPIQARINHLRSF